MTRSPEIVGLRGHMSCWLSLITDWRHAGEELDNVPEEQQIWEQIWVIPLEQLQSDSTTVFLTRPTGNYYSSRSHLLKIFLLKIVSPSEKRFNPGTDLNKSLCQHNKKEVSLMWLVLIWDWWRYLQVTPSKTIEACDKSQMVEVRICQN